MPRGRTLAAPAALAALVVLAACNGPIRTGSIGSGFAPPARTSDTGWTNGRASTSAHVIARRIGPEAAVARIRGAGVPLDVHRTLVGAKADVRLIERTTFAAGNAVRGANWLELRVRRLPASHPQRHMRVGEAALRRELAAAFPGTAMRLTALSGRNAYGAFHTATGRAGGDVTCLYAWQELAREQGRPTAGSVWRRIKGERPLALSLRLRLCRTGATPERLAEAMRELTIGDVEAAMRNRSANGWRAAGGEGFAVPEAEPLPVERVAPAPTVRRATTAREAKAVREAKVVRTRKQRRARKPLPRVVKRTSKPARHVVPLPGGRVVTASTVPVKASTKSSAAKVAIPLPGGTVKAAPATAARVTAARVRAATVQDDAALRRLLEGL